MIFVRDFQQQHDFVSNHNRILFFKGDE